MMNFDADADSIEDLLAGLDDEPELTDKKYRFKERVNSLMQHHNLLREDAESAVENVIRTKETDKRCACGSVAQFVVKATKEIVCGECRKKRHEKRLPRRVVFPLRRRLDAVGLQDVAHRLVRDFVSQVE